MPDVSENMICSACEWQIEDNIPDRRCSPCGASMVIHELEEQER